jgi:putative endonuclease
VTDRRRRLGELGERLARQHLTTRGYRVLDRNFRTRHGEIDVVAAGDGCLVFCEVKTRIAHGPPGPFGPLAAVGPRKQRQVRRMAARWLAERANRLGGEGGRPATIRFDAIGVTLSPGGSLVNLDHVENAF